MLSKQKNIQVVSFLLVGGITFLIDVSIATLLHNVFHVEAFWASGIGFLSGFFFNFPMNRNKVFGAHAGGHFFSIHWQIGIYASLCVFNLVSTSYIVSVMVAGGVGIAVAKTIVTGLIAVWNFLIFKYVLFRVRTIV